MSFIATFTYHNAEDLSMYTSIYLLDNVSLLLSLLLRNLKSSITNQFMLFLNYIPVYIFFDDFLSNDVLDLLDLMQPTAVNVTNTNREFGGVIYMLVPCWVGPLTFWKTRRRVNSAHIFNSPHRVLGNSKLRIKGMGAG